MIDRESDGDDDVLWSPPSDAREHTRIGDYLRWLESHREVRFAGYPELWRWSVDQPADFWGSIWEYFDIDCTEMWSEVLAGASMPGARWFSGARLNYAQHMLRNDTSGDVVIGVSQTRAEVRLSMNELREQVARCRAGLARIGVGRGDRVVAYLPNIPEALIAFLATASLGATWSSCPPEFGTKIVLDRFTQIEPKVLITVDGYRYGDRPIDRRSEVEAIRAGLPTLKATAWLPYLDNAIPACRGVMAWAELLVEPGPLTFEQVAFDHPLYVLFSSGTTGLPKAIVHCHGGILVEHLKTLGLQLDIQPGDVFFWFSTTGWMMWNLLVSGLLVGASVVLFDGNLAWPDLGALWRLAEEQKVTYFGTSASFLVACAKAGIQPERLADLSTMRGLGSTGSPLPPAIARWVYEHVPGRVLLGSSSGGTDLCTGVVGAVPLLPVRAGEIPCRALGARVEAFDESGRSLVGEVGELVITAPMPSMPVGFWNDHDGSRCRKAYFDTYPGVWRHGDWITITERGGCTISGRSDATLNRAGVRLGTAEYYEVVEARPDVSDSLVVHVEDPSGETAGELILFVVPAPGTNGDTLRAALVPAIRSGLSPRHVPDRIEIVAAVPRNLTGKKLEVPVKRIIAGADVSAVVAEGTLADPSSLAPYVAFAAERAIERSRALENRRS